MSKDGGFLIPENILKGGYVQHNVERPGLFWKLVRWLGQQVSDFAVMAGGDLYDAGRKFKHLGLMKSEPVYVKGLLEVMREISQSAEEEK